MFSSTNKATCAKRSDQAAQSPRCSTETRGYQIFFSLCCALGLLFLGSLPTVGDWLRESRSSGSTSMAVADNDRVERSAAGTAGTDNSADKKTSSSAAELPNLEFADWFKHTDPIVAFKLAVPLTWQRQLVVDENDLSVQDYTGYAVTYQSPPTSDSDVFSDYIMVELLADDSAGFATDGSWRVPILVDGRSATWERVALENHAVDGDSLDLVAYQLLREEPGYSLGIYVVGELKEEARLREIFTIVIDSFAFPETIHGV